MDPPVQRRSIDFTGWELVFTQSGRYFFHDTVDRCSKWRAPEHLLEYLADLSEERRALLFDPKSNFEPETVSELQEHEESPPIDYEEDYIVEEASSPGEVDEDQEDYILREEKMPTEEASVSAQPLSSKKSQHWSSREEHVLAINRFKDILLNTPNIDPFMSWSALTAQLSSDARWQAIPTDRERKSLFDELCPQLAERARQQRHQQMEEAINAWNETLVHLTLTTAPPTWVEFNRTIKAQPWFKLMDARRMEKEYRSRLAYLRTRSIVYQIPK